jgi:excisionase family DNA binding protein
MGQQGSSVARLTYDVEEVAAMLGLSRGSAYEAVRRGDIPARKIGARWIIPRVTFDRWLATAGEGAA